MDIMNYVDEQEINIELDKTLEWAVKCGVDIGDLALCFERFSDEWFDRYESEIKEYGSKKDVSSLIKIHLLEKGIILKAFFGDFISYLEDIYNL